MKIILNPDNGAPVKDVNAYGNSYFSDRDDIFMPGTLFQFEDDKVAKFFLDTFGFLTEITPNEAKKYLTTEQVKCEKCDFKTRVKRDLELHQTVHQKEKELSALGLPVIKKGQQNGLPNEDENLDIQKQIDDEGRNDGLTEGAGLTDDRPMKNVNMS